MDFKLKKVDEISRELSEFAEVLVKMSEKSEFNKMTEDCSNYSLDQKLDKIEADLEVLRTRIMYDEILKKVNTLNIEHLKKQYQKLNRYH
ncbi:hypothetical protein [Halanaerobium hydrogeniformans]|nr:hypothetical protein [Halanaerobium hydrogeniformans]